jgi:hypothetical protein
MVFVVEVLHHDEEFVAREDSIMVCVSLKKWMPDYVMVCVSLKKWMPDYVMVCVSLKKWMHDYVMVVSD